MADAGTCGTGEKTPFEHNIEFVQGDSWEETWTVWESDCTTPYDFTGHTLELVIETLSYGRDIIRLTEGSGIDSSVPGTIDFWITTDESALMDPGTNNTNFSVTNPDTTKKTWSYGLAKILRSNLD